MITRPFPFPLFVESRATSTRDSRRSTTNRQLNLIVRQTFAECSKERFARSCQNSSACNKAASRRFVSIFFTFFNMYTYTYMCVGYYVTRSLNREWFCVQKTGQRETVILFHLRLGVTWEVKVIKSSLRVRQVYSTEWMTNVDYVIFCIRVRSWFCNQVEKFHSYSSSFFSFFYLFSRIIVES